ncbi:MAG: phage tail protein [Bacteroidales bacterium]
MSLFSNDIRVANTATPSFQQQANVGQFGWTGADQGHYNQLIQYVDECRNIYLGLESKLEYIENLLGEVADIDEQIKYVTQKANEVAEDARQTTVDVSRTTAMYRQTKDLSDVFDLKYVDFNTKYSDFFVKYPETIDAALSASVSEAGAREWYDKSKDLYDDLKEGQVYRGTWNPKINAYPAHEGTNSVWDVILDDGVLSVDFDGHTWRSGDRLLYVVSASEYQRLATGSGVSSINGEVGAVTLTAEKVGALGKTANAVSATKLATARTISGVAFDGTKDISLTPADIYAVPLDRKINNKPLSADVTLSAGDVGAVNKTGDAMTGDLSMGSKSINTVLGINSTVGKNLIRCGGTGSVDVVIGSKDGRVILDHKGKIEARSEAGDGFVYTTFNQPAAADIGAIPVTGGNITGKIRHTYNTAVKLPSGTTADRGNGEEGDIRFNNTDKSFEGYNGTAWAPIGSNTINYSIKDSSFLAEKNTGYMVNTSAATITVTLPLAIKDNEFVIVGDYSGKADIHPIKIKGFNSDTLVLDKPNVMVQVTYLSGKWVVTDGIGESQLADIRPLVMNGTPVLSTAWVQLRRSMWLGYAPADGQLLNRELYPAAYEAIEAGLVPVCTDAEWLKNPAKRGCFTLGNGRTTFRVPDYNGFSEDSLGAMFQRGDGLNSAGTNGEVQGDAIRNIVGEFELVGATTNALVFSSQAIPVRPSGAFAADGALVSNQVGTHAGLNAINGNLNKFDASRIVPTAADNHPVNVTGCWAVKLFDAVKNIDQLDAAKLEAELAVAQAKIAEAQSKIAALEQWPQSGSNANGSWVKHRDGTMICSFSGVFNVSINNVYGSLFYDSLTLTFPATFIAPPDATIGSARWGSGASWGTLAGRPTTTAIPIRILDVSKRAAGETEISYTAIGRWK